MLIFHEDDLLAMKRSLALGRIMGIEIKFHYSWFFVFALVVISLALGYMPHQYPNLSHDTYWAIGLVSAAVLFSSVMFHELSHSYEAIKKCIRIPSIVLFFFGGVAQMAEEPRKPDDEIKVAIAGPLFRFAVGGMLLSLWYFAEFLSLGIEISAILRYGGTINLILGSFNMIPAFPLDGGRVLRGTLWRRSGDLMKATASAVRVSMVFAYALIIGSFPVILLARDASGFWLFLVGMFLKSAAESSMQQMLLKHRLEGVSAGEIALPAATIAP
ncbi:MAG: site-2 protease family protein [Nitrososphaerales archaeon]